MYPGNLGPLFLPVLGTRGLTGQPPLLTAQLLQGFAQVLGVFIVDIVAVNSELLIPTSRPIIPFTGVGSSASTI